MMAPSPTATIRSVNWWPSRVLSDSSGFLAQNYSRRLSPFSTRDLQVLPTSSRKTNERWDCDCTGVNKYLIKTWRLPQHSPAEGTLGLNCKQLTIGAQTMSDEV